MAFPDRDRSPRMNYVLAAGQARQHLARVGRVPGLFEDGVFQDHDRVGSQDDREVRTVRAPTLIVLGDRDVATPEHAVELTRLIPGARLLILPGGHGDYLGEIVMTQRETRYPELTAGLTEEFLDSP